MLRTKPPMMTIQAKLEPKPAAGTSRFRIASGP